MDIHVWYSLRQRPAEHSHLNIVHDSKGESRDCSMRPDQTSRRIYSNIYLCRRFRWYGRALKSMYCGSSREFQSCIRGVAASFNSIKHSNCSWICSADQSRRAFLGSKDRRTYSYKSGVHSWGDLLMWSTVQHAFLKCISRSPTESNASLQYSQKTVTMASSAALAALYSASARSRANFALPVRAWAYSDVACYWSPGGTEAGIMLKDDSMFRALNVPTSL